MKKRIMMLLCVSMVSFSLAMTGCNAAQAEKGTEQSAEAGIEEVGEGTAYTFDFQVADQDGNETDFIVHTDETTVGAALLAAGLIEGDEGDYGLYVKKVNGMEADYDKDGVYWAFYVNGEYAETGVDATDIVDGNSYAFKIEK